MMEVEELFIRASEEFEDRNYEKGLGLISRCIEKDRENSLLYCNRGLFFAQLGENETAARDLEKAIELNHLNYLAYFNLFSLQFRQGEEDLAFDNLCCSLSCLYLVRAKKSRRELDVQKSISYADNNFEAYVLKSLMYLEEGRLTLALNNIEWACDLNPNSLLCLKLKNIIAKKVDPYSPEEPIGAEAGPSRGIRLRSSYRPEKDTFELQVRQKINEFNQVYQDLLGEEGTITQKVPRIMGQNDKTVEKSKLLSELSGIYEFKLKSHKRSEIVHHEEPKEEVHVQETIPPEEVRDESNLLLNEDLKQSWEDLSPVKPLIETKENEDQQNLLDGSLEQKKVVEEKPVEPVKQEYVPVEQHDENLLDEEASLNKGKNLSQRPPSAKKDDSPVPARKSVDNKNTRSASSSKKGTASNSKVSEMSSNSESVSLYPIRDKKKIQFTVVAAEVKHPGNFKDFYITGNYNSRKGQRLRTAIKKIEGSSCHWYAGNPPTSISETAQTLSVKLYSKQYFSVNDELIGEGEVEVLRSGEIKIPVYYKTKTTAFVMVRVDLI